MGLLQKAIETYDFSQDLVGVYKTDKEPLAPVGHIIANPSIEITIDTEGKYIRAIKRDKESGKIIIPATESSASRSSTAIRPHGLCEQLGYISSMNNAKKEAFLEQLSDWSSHFPNRKTEAVLKYVSSGTILTDLCFSGPFKLQIDEKGNIKYDGFNDKSMVCWKVIGSKIDESPVWTDKELFNIWIKYILKKKEENEKTTLSYVSGKREVEAIKNLKGVVSFKGNAKIISSNDDSGFTFRGRFATAEEAMGISYKDSQKAHNALKWILSNQGVQAGERVFACWSPCGDVLPAISVPLLEKTESKRIPTEYKEDLKKAVNSYKNNLSHYSEAIIASFEAATNGRLAVTCFNNLQGSVFLDRLKYWDETCCWYDNRYGTFSPALYSIIKYAFGSQQKNDEKAEVKVDDRIVGFNMQRLLLCRLEKSPFPTDIIKALCSKSSRLLCYNKKNRDKLLFVTCAAIRKYYLDKFRKEFKMALEPNKKDRSYQFGRLLAVLEKIERDTYEKDEKREPYAIRMQSVFVQRPGYASKVITNQLKNAYYLKLKPGQRQYYEKLIGEIMQNISETDMSTYNNPLGETFTMGYYLQKNTLYTKKNESDSLNKEEEE